MYFGTDYLNKAEEAQLREPKEILAESEKLDEETPKILHFN